MGAVLTLVMRFIGPVLGVKADLEAAAVGDHVETDQIGHVRIFGRKCRPYVVFEVEE